MKAKYGFSESQVKPYTFSMAPFLADKELTQQGYISSEPFAIEKGGVKPNVFLLADYGYPDYAATIDTTHDMVKKNPDLVRRFVQATMEGWKSYLSGDPAPANALIKKDNPQMTDEQIAYGISKVEFVETERGEYLIVAATSPAQALKGLLRKPATPVSIDEMNQAIASQGAKAR
jgi:NitT/TauT family transport system substrate-binding protein